VLDFLATKLGSWGGRLPIFLGNRDLDHIEKSQGTLRPAVFRMSFKVRRMFTQPISEFLEITFGPIRIFLGS
jgi:hypothetical protein